MLASKLILKCLERESVNLIFGYPGGALLPLYEALRESDIQHILVRNEQAAPHYASGYARESGKVGVCLATSGPGATNLITGIATAYLDSIPLVILTGQVNVDLIGTDAFQEADIYGATVPFTKHSYLVKEAKDIPRIIKEAFHIAKTGRPGPVLIDLPRDVQLTTIKNVKYCEQINIRGYKPTYEGHKGQIKRALRKIKSARRPVIYAGGGAIISKAEEALLTFAHQNNIPVMTTLMGIGAFPEDDPLYCGIIGSHGYAYSEKILDQADLCICIGARMSDRATANGLEELNQMPLIHIDIDPAEIGKNVDQTNIPIVGDAKTVLMDFISKPIEGDTTKWIKIIEKIKTDCPLCFDEQMENGKVNPKYLFKQLSEITSDDATIVADVGLNQIWAALYYQIKGNRHYFTSGGLGTMGYSVPAAAGVAFAADDQHQIFAVCGDGAFQMTIGELAIIKSHQLNVNILLFNNQKLGMVRQLQHDVYGNRHYCGTDIDFNPDFEKIAEAYGIQYYKIAKNETMESILEEAILCPGPTLIECIVDEDFMKI